MKIYTGIRISLGKNKVLVGEYDPGELALEQPLYIEGKPLKHYPLHSPDGFEWGYGGSGPADLALAILIDHFGEDPSPADLYMGNSRAQEGGLYQDFKWAIIAKISADAFAIRERDIRNWIGGDTLAGLFGADVRIAEEKS